MNKQQRKQIENAIALLESAKATIDDIKDEEQDKFDNLSEGLQATEANQKLEQNAFDLADRVEEIESCIEELTAIIER